MDRDRIFRSLDRKVLQTEIPVGRDFSLKYLSIQRSEMRLISIRYPPRSMPRRIYHARSESEAVPVHRVKPDFFFSARTLCLKRKNLWPSPDEPAPLRSLLDKIVIDLSTILSTLFINTAGMREGEYRPGGYRDQITVDSDRWIERTFKLKPGRPGFQFEVPSIQRSEMRLISIRYLPGRCLDGYTMPAQRAKRCRFIG